MTIQTYWQIDVAADATRSEARARPNAPTLFRDVRTDASNRHDYYAQIAQAASQTAFDGLFVQYRPESDDSLIVAATIAREAPRLALIPEFPAWVGSAVYAAKQAVSFQRGTHERLGWAIAPSADAATRARDGDHVPTEELIERTEEFLKVARGVHAERPFSHTGQHFEVQDGGFEAPLNGVAFPRVFLQGDTDDELKLSARVADVHLFAAAPLSTLRRLTEELSLLSRAEDRSVAFGVIQPVLAREFADEAQHDAQRAGLPASAIVGDYADVAAQLSELAALGFAYFVLTAPSSLEEAYVIGQHVLPRFRALTETVRAAS
ncbi:LLM class flavin-dependent oxidoreductase [Sphingomonas paeninsulae]|uniref:LLM class flavin-dependent oxidoreductase n=1 Tax=Sphingomonas paeninsulae TaxID=2319844 RepID=A0A494TJZ1_SPHPE|nr:LLM class flavin-dependent oxidoreductase [Sphingomonas paeninsulae]AYJ87722.1 LLM class flavin-dependent oxidoreductase [Sphingomonas paeninsulae]